MANLYQLARVCDLFSKPMRLAVVQAIQNGATTVEEIGNAIDASPSTIRLTLSSLIFEHIIIERGETYTLNDAMPEEAKVIVGLLAEKKG